MTDLTIYPPYDDGFGPASGPWGHGTDQPRDFRAGMTIAIVYPLAFWLGVFALLARYL